MQSTRIHKVGCQHNDGFLYEDTLVGVTLFMIMIPYIFMIYNYCTTGIREAYINDKVLQQVSNQLEVGKAEYFYSKSIGNLNIGNSRFDTGEIASDMQVLDGITYKSNVKSVEVNHIGMLQYKVQAMKDGVVVYEASTYLLPKTSKH